MYFGIFEGCLEFGIIGELATINISMYHLKRTNISHLASELTLE